jgi:cytochrome P450
MIPPKPIPRADRVSLWRYLRLFRRDILSAQPERLYSARMAAFKTPFFRSFLINQPDLIDDVLKARPEAFPKSDRIGEGLRPLLGKSVFVTNGETWQRQRRIIDPAFEGGKLKQSFGAMRDAGAAAAARIGAGVEDIEAATSFAAADVIFRTLFSLPIETDQAGQVYRAFQRYQQAQPILNLAAFLPLPRWMPRLHKPATKDAAREIRALITDMTEARQAAIRDGTAPDDLATRIMTTPDPETGAGFDTGEMVDQVAIFFLAGHETSASALAWALYLLATHPEAQARVAAEAAEFAADPSFARLSTLRFTRDVFRETLRLYPPVPMMVREATLPETFRDRDVPKGAQIVISPWHLHRHTRHWADPDSFDPDRWASDDPARCPRDAYLPFSAGPRVCPGAGFAMIEGPLLLAMLVGAAEFTPIAGDVPMPMAHLTVRSKTGIRLRTEPRGTPSETH